MPALRTGPARSRTSAPRWLAGLLITALALVSVRSTHAATLLCQVLDNEQRPVRHAKVRVLLQDGTPLGGEKPVDEKGIFRRQIEGTPRGPLLCEATAAGYERKALFADEKGGVFQVGMVLRRTLRLEVPQPRQAPDGKVLVDIFVRTEARLLAEGIRLVLELPRENMCALPTPHILFKVLSRFLVRQGEEASGVIAVFDLTNQNQPAEPLNATLNYSRCSDSTLSLEAHYPVEFTVGAESERLRFEFPPELQLQQRLPRRPMRLWFAAASSPGRGEGRLSLEILLPGGGVLRSPSIPLWVKLDRGTESAAALDEDSAALRQDIESYATLKSSSAPAADVSQEILEMPDRPGTEPQAATLLRLKTLLVKNPRELANLLKDRRYSWLLQLKDFALEVRSRLDPLIRDRPPASEP